MTRKRNKFFLFCCSMVPGAGEMFMGFFKQGFSLMTLFFLIITLAAWLNVGALTFLLPALWFYSFFHANNLNGLPEEEFYLVEDDFFFNPGDAFSPYFLSRYRKLIAIILILLGVTIVWNNFVGMFIQYLPSLLQRLVRSFDNHIPQIIVGCGIVLAGLYLISGKKKELEDKQ